MSSAGACMRCGTDRWKRHRHHVLPRSLGGTDEPDNIEYLCANCHEDAHAPGSGLSPGVLGHTPEAKARRSAALTRLWEEPEYRAKMAARPHPSTVDPEYGAKVAAGMRGNVNGRGNGGKRRALAASR